MAENNKSSDSSSDIHDKVDRIIDDVNQRVSDAMQQVNQKIDEITGKSNRKTKKQKDNTFWGIVMIVVGFFWLGNNLDWFDFNIPIWPIAIIIVGLYLLIEGRR